MATYQEIRGLFNDNDLNEKVEVAMIISANNLLTGTETSAQKAWVAQALTSPRVEAKKAVMAVLASNSSLTVAQIQSASDSAIQTNVDDIIGTLVDALAGV